MITTSNLSVSINGHSILRDLTFEVPKGSMTAIVGPNGSGKTTLVRTVLGLQVPTDGSVQIHAKKIGYVPQSLPVDQSVPMTGLELISLNCIGLAKSERAIRIQQAIEAVDASEFSGVRLANLSGGQFQRILLARAFVQNPDLLVLDEPTSGLDMEATESLYQLLQKRVNEHGVTVVMISHDVDMISKFVTHVICINQTLVCAGPPSEALSDESMQKLYGDHMHANSHHAHSHDV